MFIGLPCGNQVSHFPEPIGHTSSHRRSRAESAMNLDEVVCEVPERNRRRVVLDLFRECVSQPRESANRHPNREIVTLDITAVDVLRVRGSGNRVALAAKARSGAVALLSVVGDSVDLNQHRVVNVAAERLVNRLNVEFQAIAGKLDAIGQPPRKIFDEVSRAVRVALRNKPTGYQLGIGVNRGPEPRIASAGVLLGHIRRNVLLLGVHKRPAFIHLHPFAVQVTECPVLVIGAEGANRDNQADDGLLGNSRHTNGGANRASLNQATDDLGALFRSEAVHVSIMREPLTHVKTFGGLFPDRLRRGSIGVRAVRPTCLGRKGSRLAALFASHPSGPRRAADLPSAPSQFGHDAGNLGRSRAVLLFRWIGEHFVLIVGKLVKIGFGFVARAFRRHTLSVSHGCVSGSSVRTFKVAHYPISGIRPFRRRSGYATPHHPGPPPLTLIPFPACCAHYPGGPDRCTMVIVMARSRAGFFPIRAAFSAFAPDRYPQGSFRGLLKLHTRGGPPDCSPAICGHCREVPISPVTRTHRSPDVAAKHQLFEWVLPSLVISPFGAPAKAPAPHADRIFSLIPAGSNAA